MTLVYTVIGFALAGYSVIANDSIQTLGTFIASKKKWFKWYTLAGSAHCELIPYWSKKLNKKELLANQISKRGGKLYCTHNKDRVTIGGEAVTFLRGEIEI